MISWIKFIFQFTDNLDATEIPDHSNVNRVANLLGVTSQQLVDALTRKTIFAQGDTVVSYSNCLCCSSFNAYFDNAI